ncbi:MAG: potassium channel family protein [Bacteroidales bacterium]|nr:potassium channel family protein [Bacteroidales bacterium]
MYPTSFKYYKIRIIDKPFQSFSGKNYKQTACISFLNESKHEIYYTEIGYLETEEIYKQIIANEPIDLNEVFIENFDVNQIPVWNDSEKRIFNLTCQNAIFSAQKATNFSNVIFSGMPVCFQNTLFLRGNVLFENCIFEAGNANFNSVVFYSGNVSFFNANFVKGEIDFKNTFFGDGSKNFQYVFWGNGDILFSNSYWGNGNVSFVNASFGDGSINFKVAVFGKGLKDFKFAIFGNTQLSFERADIGEGVLDFSKTEFGNSKINFNKTIFHNTNVLFDESEIATGKMLIKSASFEEGKISFDEGKFTQTDIYFDKTTFFDTKISFYKASVKDLSFEACSINSYADLRLQYCEKLNLSDAFIHDIIDLSLEDNPTAIKAINLFGCRLMGSLFHSWDRNQVYNQIKSNAQQNANHFSWQFNLLKRNFNNTGQYDDEDKAYVAFRREELKLYKQKIQQSSWYIQIYLWFAYYFQKIVFDKMGLYATSPLRVFKSIVVVWALFGVLFSLFHFFDWGKTWSSVGNPDKMSIIAQSFYHSAITFFTIGYGDVFPQGLSRILSSIEGFVGVFMMSYFTVAFVRKVLR